MVKVMKLVKIDKSFLRSKVARRLFALFVGCVLVPIVVLAILSFEHVSRQLKDQSLLRLQQAAKVHGLSIYEHLLAIEGDMKLVAAMIAKQATDFDFAKSDEPFMQRLSQRFNSMALVPESGEPQLIFGASSPLPDIVKELAKLPADRSTILIREQPDQHAKVFMVQKIEKGMLVAELNVISLWGIGYDNILPPMTDLCILDQSRKAVISSFSVPNELVQKIVFNKSGDGPRYFEYRDDDEAYLTSFWPLYLRGHFDAESLTVVLRQAKADVLAPMKDFVRIFPLVVLLALWFVLLFSFIYIRKTLVPIEELKEGTSRLAQGDFTNTVQVKSGDEFEELATSFNNMTGQIDRQFKALAAISEIGQSILSSLDKKQIIETALASMYQFFSCDSVRIVLLDGNNAPSGRSYSFSHNPGHKIQEDMIEVYPDEQKHLSRNPNYLFLKDKEHLPHFLANADADRGLDSYLLLPLFAKAKEELIGLVILGHGTKKDYNEDDFSQARQLADQLAIALSNASMIKELEGLSWGTLEALARTVDAKSSWTAGHSERVTDLSVKIARYMKCSKQEVETIQRAALIHDIGKVGISQTILDKPDRLTDEEFEQIKEHPLIGARILVPIKAFADTIPIVLYHHEKFDGTGYPHNLEGDAIPLGARILSVADVYDALISDRPYRDGWVREKVFELITEQAGKQFDPQVVKAFLIAMS